MRSLRRRGRRARRRARYVAFFFYQNVTIVYVYEANTRALQAELQAELDALRRENRLVTSAWYDMTTRLQSNTVVLQRKSEAPKSWVGRQRALVGAGALPGRR